MKKRIITHQPEVKQVTRFKMYKDGKNWITAGLSRFTFLTKKSDMANQATETKEKGQAQHGLLKGLIGVGALLGGTVMTNSDVFADTPVANEKGAAADNVVDQTTVTIPAGSTASSQSASTSTVSESTVTSTVATDKVASVSEHTAASEVTKASTSLAASATPGSTSTSANVGSQQVAGSTNESTSESGNTSAANASSMSAVNDSKNVTDNNGQATEGSTILTGVTVQNGKSSIIQEPDYPQGMPRSNDTNLYDFDWIQLYADYCTNTSKGDILVSMSRDGSGTLVVTEITPDGKREQFSVSRSQGTVNSKLFSLITYNIEGEVGSTYLRMQSYNQAMVAKYLNGVGTYDHMRDNTLVSFLPQKIQKTVDIINQQTGRVEGKQVIEGWTGEHYTASAVPVKEGYYAVESAGGNRGTFSQYDKVGSQYTIKLPTRDQFVFTLMSSDGTMHVVHSQPDDWHQHIYMKK